MRADGTCTPLAELTTAALVERTRTYLDTADLPLDRPVMHAADAVRSFLNENRVAELALPRRTEELGPLVHAIDYGPPTFLTNLGFSVYEGRALNTVPLAEVRVDHAFDLATLTFDVTSLLLTAGNMTLGFTGVASSVTTPLSIIQTLAFSPATYGAPILKGSHAVHVRRLSGLFADSSQKLRPLRGVAKDCKIRTGSRHRVRRGCARCTCASSVRPVRRWSCAGFRRRAARARGFPRGDVRPCCRRSARRC